MTGNQAAGVSEGEGCRGGSVLRSKLLRGICVSYMLAGYGLSGQERVLSAGHYGLAVSYERAGGWEVYINEYETGAKLPAYATVLRIGEAARAEVPADPAYRFLGAAGQAVWIVPEIYNPEILYMGIGAPLLERGVFSGGLSNRGQLSMALVGVEGSGWEAGGHVAMWQAGYPPRIYISTADGIGSEDALEGVTANFHAHFNWGFTAPGLYRLRFRFSGTLVPELGGQNTTTEAVFTLEVADAGDASPFRYAWREANGWAWSSWIGYIRAAEKGWWQSQDYGWVYPLDGGPDSLWLYFWDAGWVWSSQWLFPWVWDPYSGEWGYRRPLN